MDLNRLFSKDGGHTTQPYLPLEPEIAITTGQYASQVDVLLGLSFFFSFSCLVCLSSSLFLNLAICEGSVANETLIGTEFFLAAPGEA